MTIEAKLGAILVADAAVFAIAGDRVSAETAPQRTEQPYIVLKLLGGPPIHLHDGNPVPTRRWVYQLAAIAPSLAVAAELARVAEIALVHFTDSPAPGVQRILQTAHGAIFLEAERNHQRTVDLDIIENLA